jgi:hypothetical protein
MVLYLHLWILKFFLDSDFLKSDSSRFRTSGYLWENATRIHQQTANLSKWGKLRFAGSTDQNKKTPGKTGWACLKLGSPKSIGWLWFMIILPIHGYFGATLYPIFRHTLSLFHVAMENRNVYGQIIINHLSMGHLYRCEKIKGYLQKGWLWIVFHNYI